MRRAGRLRHIILLAITLLLGINSYAQQEDEYESLLQRVDTIENPVYKPVISVAYGVLNFIGDVKSSYRMPVVGNPSFKLSITTFIDNQQHFAANFFFLTGKLTGEQSSFSDVAQNLNFSSSIYSIGATARYDFGHLISPDLRFRPFISFGIEQLNFNTKGDLFDEDGILYQYWPDGTIRSIPVNDIGAALPLDRDYVYETDLRSYERNMYDLGKYNPRSIALPLELGFSMDLSERVAISLGTEYHFTFTDYIDNVSSEGTYVSGNKAKDGFFLTQMTLHFDMFSDPKTRTVDLLFADVELDPIFFDDEDGDFVLDVADRCPGTPYGVVTDTLGCPLDGDNDGVPDYLDKEVESPAGVWVDDQGVTLKEEDFLKDLKRENALQRSDLEAYMALYKDRFKERAVIDIPEKFTSIDSDEDGYISFEELLRVIDDYFDFKVDLSLDELRQVNEFFFSQ